MFLGKYYVSNHAVQQYKDRVKNRKFQDIKKCIKNDLRTLNIRHIINIGEETHIFTKGNKEFIFVNELRNKRKEYVLKTVIKRNFEENLEVVERRKLQQKKYLEKIS